MAYSKKTEQCFVLVTEYQKEDVWLHRGIFGRCEMDLTQLYYL